MNRSFATLLLFIIFIAKISAQNNSTEIKNHFNHRLDSIISSFEYRYNNLSQMDETDMSNPLYYRLFAPPTLYKRSIKRGFNLDRASFVPSNWGTMLRGDENRDCAIDRLMLHFYKTNPMMVRFSEDELRREISSKDALAYQKAPEITINTEVPVFLPENMNLQLETKVVKPNYWRTSGNFSMNFSQNYFSGNWAAGGENSRTMLANLLFFITYNDKNKVQFENKFEAKLGFYTSTSDTVHKFKTNNDLVRFTSKLNYQSIKNLYYTIQGQVATQFLPYYEANKQEYRSNFMAPFYANFSFGIDYKRSMPRWNMSIYLAPLSAYNYRFVRYSKIATAHFGIREGRHHFEDFGTKLEINANWLILKNVSWNTRFYYYTTYTRVEHDWENTISFILSKYLTAKMFIHSRYDDKSRKQYSDSYGYWQIKEYMTFGIAYGW